MKHKITNHPHPLLTNVIRYAEYISHLHNSIEKKVSTAVKITHHYLGENNEEIYVPNIVSDKIDILNVLDTDYVDINGNLLNPDQNGEYPEDSLTAYQYWLATFQQPQIVLDVIDAYIVQAASNGRFDNYE